MDINTITSATDKQKIGAAMFSDKFNIMVAGALAFNNTPHNSRAQEAFNLTYALGHRDIPEGYNKDDIKELLKIRKDYDLETQISFDRLAEAFHEQVLFGGFTQNMLFCRKSA